MRRTARSIILASLAVLFIPVPAFAFTPLVDPIVPEECKCWGVSVPGADGTVYSAPDYGCALQVIQNVMNVVVSLAMILVVIYAVIAAFQFMLSGSGSEAISKAKTRITNVLLGTLVFLAAWLIVDFVMKNIYDSGDAKFGPWNSILAGDPNGADRCIVTSNPDGLTSGYIPVIEGTPGQGGGVGGPTGAQNGTSNTNSSSATGYLKSHASSKSGGNCWKAVRQAICAGGNKAFCTPGPLYAKQAGSKLTANGYVAVYSGTYSYPSSDKAFSYKTGDVAIFQPGCTSSNAGHAAMYTGSQWISDFTQQGMGPNTKGNCKFTVYRP